jgi:sugar O-acyltransferase (sialic acid O-acetyltransferase NeuD family)
LAIVGVGGHGRECLDIAEAAVAAGTHLEISGFFDDAPSEVNSSRVHARGYRILGTFDDLLRDGGYTVCLGVGNAVVRAELGERLAEHGIPSPVLLHPDSSVGARTSLAPGAVLFAGARVTTDVRIGRHAHVNQNATVGHDCILSDYATVHPLAAVSGDVVIGRAAMVGAGAVVLPGVTVGDEARVGAGSCVVRDVSATSVVKGVPAR